MREQARVLDDVPDPAPERGRCDLGGVLVVQPDLPAGRFDHPVDHPQRGGLTAS